MLEQLDDPAVPMVRACTALGVGLLLYRQTQRSPLISTSTTIHAGSMTRNGKPCSTCCTRHAS